MKILIMGSGGSMGTPVIGCKCPVCLSRDPFDRRLRSSSFLEVDGKKFLIDVSPDIRQMVLEHQIDHIDGVFITHFHEDHVGGLNDLRPFFFHFNQKPLPLVLSENTYNVISTRFPYLMNRFETTILSQQTGKGEVLGVTYNYFTYSQQTVPVNGFRFGDVAYVTDIKEYSEDIFEELDGVKTLFVSFICENGSSMHFSLDEALRFIKRSGAKKAYLVHISHRISHKDLLGKIPANVLPSFDGLEIEL